MRKNTIILMLMFLAAAFQWGCQKETVTPADEDISLRNPKPHDHGGGGGGGTVDIFRVEITGGTITADVTYLVGDNNSPKSDGMVPHTCGSTQVSGISSLPLSITNGCYITDPYCGRRSVRLPNKKKNPGEVQTMFIFNREAGSSSTRFMMYGTIDGGGNTIFPSVAGPAGAVSITLNEYRIAIGPAACQVDPFTALPASSTMTIELLANPADACLEHTPCNDNGLGG
jgi:hypothetical protein